MSLQGSLQTISLPNVLNLLVSAGVTGKLTVDSGGTEGCLWLDAGELSAFEVSGCAEAVDAVFELLRREDGTFGFAPGMAPSGEDRYEIAPLIEQATARLSEWKDLASIVPSQDHHVRLVAELDSDRIEIDKHRWSLLVAVGDGHEVHSVIGRCGLSQIEGMRGIKDLVEAGLAVVEQGVTVSPVAEAVPTGSGDREITWPVIGARPAASTAEVFSSRPINPDVAAVVASVLASAEIDSEDGAAVVSEIDSAVAHAGDATADSGVDEAATGSEEGSFEGDGVDATAESIPKFKIVSNPFITEPAEEISPSTDGWKSQEEVVLSEEALVATSSEVDPSLDEPSGLNEIRFGDLDTPAGESSHSSLAGDRSAIPAAEVGEHHPTDANEVAEEVLDDAPSWDKLLGDEFDEEEDHGFVIAPRSADDDQEPDDRYSITPRSPEPINKSLLLKFFSSVRS